MYSEMNPFIRSRSNDWLQFIPDVGIFALSVAFPFILLLPFTAITAS
jgi:hypothetical protein